MAAPEPCSDFIFLAEMCERNGPVVIESYPMDALVPLDLPVRLFSCDMYGPPHSVQAEGGADEFLLQRDSFCIMRLSQQLPPHQQRHVQQQPILALGSPAQAGQEAPPPPGDSDCAHAAVHHFQMCEMSGRGLIRKVCVAFVTNDPHKITRNMTIINRQLIAVARCVCEGNAAAFKADAAAILSDLRQLIDPPALDAFPDLKEALPVLLRQYELLSTRPLMNPAPAFNPAPALPTPGGFFAPPFSAPVPPSAAASAEAAPPPPTAPPALHNIPPASPLDRLKMLQAYGRPLETWRPFMSTLPRQRQRAISAALLAAHDVCSLQPDVMWMLSEEARFLTAGDVSGDTPHSCVCDGVLGSLSAYMKRSNLQAAPAPAVADAALDRPFLEFPGNAAVSVMLRHHLLSQKAKESAAERTQALLSTASVSSSSKQPVFRSTSGRPSIANAATASAAEAFGLQETRQLLTEPLFKNVVFALLKGENVLVRGKPDEQPLVMGIVRALAVFIPQNALYLGTKDGPQQPTPMYVAHVFTHFMQVSL